MPRPWRLGPSLRFAETVRVRNIHVSETAGNTAVVIAASARPTFTTWKLEQPARVVVELSGARLGNVEVPIDAGTYAVGLVSASVTEDDSAGPRTRIVLTLRQASDYQVEAKGNDITLRVVPRVRPLGATQAKADAEATSEAQRRTEAKLHDESKQRLAAEAKAEERARIGGRREVGSEQTARRARRCSAGDGEGARRGQRGHAGESAPEDRAWRGGSTRQAGASRGREGTQPCPVRRK